MKKYLLIAIVAGLGIAILRKAKGTAGMTDTPVSLENVRRGVKNGWYTCTLVRMQGRPAVRLSGKNTNGQMYSDVYPISEADWQTLKNEGYDVKL